MKTFEERLNRLEQIGELLRDGSVPLNEASDLFREGVSLAQSLEKELRTVEKKVEMVVNTDPEPGETPVLELFPELGGDD